MKKFTLLGITFESKLEELDSNFEEKLLKTMSLIEKWKRRRLTVSGRIGITKCILLSNFVYLLTILDTNISGMCERLQTVLDAFIKGDTKRKWASANYLYTDKIEHFVKGLKAAWMRRYIQGTKDAWTEQLYQRFNVQNRETVTMMGDLKIMSLAKPELKCLSEVIRAHGEITKEMVTEQKTKDNSWFQQACFNSSLVKT